MLIIEQLNHDKEKARVGRDIKLTAYPHGLNFPNFLLIEWSNGKRWAYLDEGSDLTIKLAPQAGGKR